MPLSESFDKKIAKNENAESYSVNAEDTERVLLHKIHEEVDDKHRYEEGYHDTDEQKKELKGCRCKACKNEFQNLKKRCAKHDGNRQEEGKLCGCGAGYTGEHTAEDR